MSFDFTTWVEGRRAIVEASLADLFSATQPAGFRQACQYPLQTGGKRVRPLIALAAAEAVSGQVDHPCAVRAGVAVELVHTYSLVHDDLPSMDDDDERRGHPTVHRKYDEATAILVGDALLTEAFAYVAVLGDAALAGTLARAAGALGMVGGQALDIDRTTDWTLEKLEEVHRKKTGALLTASAVLGAQAVGASSDAVAALERFGRAVGLAFQLADDLLDADEDAMEGGPPSYVRLLGAEETKRRAQEQRDAALDAISGWDHAEPLRALANYIVDRSH